MKKIGFLVNPVAGIGGPAGMKGSDGWENRERAKRLGYGWTAGLRACECLRQISGVEGFEILAAPGEMGADLLNQMGMPYRLAGMDGGEGELESYEYGHTSREDTIANARYMQKMGADLIVFCGGDGTARDMCEAVGENFPVLGVPAGVKMYSACYGMNPFQAGEMLKNFIGQKDVLFEPAEVMDLDEDDLAKVGTSPSLCGFLLVPADQARRQRCKEVCLGGKVEAEEMADCVVNGMHADTIYIIGPGATTAGIKKKLQGEWTLRGVDVARNGRIIRMDADEKTLFEMLVAETDRRTTDGKRYGRPEECADEGRWSANHPARILVTCIGGNGFVFGRGNQQISPRIIRMIGKENIQIVATREKLARLGGNPMRVDTGDRETDRYLAGYYRIMQNSRETALYRVENC